MRASFDAVNDDVLLELLMHAGPFSALRQCNRLLHDLGNGNVLWQTFAEDAGIRVFPSNDNCSWQQVFKNAETCSHSRLVRDLRFTSLSSEPSPDFKTFISDAQHPAMRTSCECTRCKRLFTLVIKPCFDPAAFGLRMEDVEFRSVRDDRPRWSERWYMIGESMYSIKGDEHQPLDDCESKIHYETTVNSFTNMLRM